MSFKSRSTSVATRRSRDDERANGAYTVPQIFIGAAHIGGCDDLYALDAPASSIRCWRAPGPPV